MQMEVVDLGVIVRRLEPMLRRLIGEDVKLVTVAPDGTGHVLADPGQIEQVIVNLAVNAGDDPTQADQFVYAVQNNGASSRSICDSAWDSERLDWFRTINIAGEKLTEQEAFRFIQRTAMDRRSSMRDVASAITLRISASWSRIVPAPGSDRYFLLSSIYPHSPVVLL